MARKNREAIPIQPVNPLKPLEQNPFYTMPDSPASHLIMDVLGAGVNVADLEERKKQINHTAAVKINKNGSRRQIISTSPKAEVTIEIADIDKLAGSNKAAKKLFVLALIKANEQAIHGGKLTYDHVTFTLEELVETGFYSTPQSARIGFRAGVRVLLSIQASMKVQPVKKKDGAKEVSEVLFTGARIDRGQCTIFFNERINWSFIVQYFTILPRYYFSLPNRPSDLLYYIFYLARQNTREIEKHGYFIIKFKAIQQRLFLPEENSTKNPQRDIKAPIEEAIAQITQAQITNCNSTELKLIPVYDEAASISEYLNKGCLQVYLSGDFAKTFIAISKETAKQIDTAQKRQDRITEKAAAIKAAKKMDTEKQ